METVSQISVLTISELYRYIELLRKDLIQTGLTFGFNDQRTIQASQELDFFIFEYQKMTH